MTREVSGLREGNTIMDCRCFGEGTWCRQCGCRSSACVCEFTYGVDSDIRYCDCSKEDTMEPELITAKNLRTMCYRLGCKLVAEREGRKLVRWALVFKPSKGVFGHVYRTPNGLEYVTATK